ncbi:Uncharacterized protein Fot_11053 [Forsythia ovata]|uniref:Uncharacterized protein n=1 Tax=Forsythia ovata TaxID=205694 RepID=A0ABD1WIL9_9LAMI
MAGNKPLLQPIQPHGAPAPFAYTEALELFQCHTIRPSLVHKNLLDNVVQLDERIFDVFLDKHERQWKVQKYSPNIVTHWKVEALLDMFLHLYEYFNEVYSYYLETNEMEKNIEQSSSEEGD